MLNGEQKKEKKLNFHSKLRMIYIIINILLDYFCSLSGVHQHKIYTIKYNDENNDDDDDDDDDKNNNKYTYQYLLIKVTN